MRDFGDLRLRRRRLPEDNFADEQWERHKEVVAKRAKLWAKAQPARWVDLDPWKRPEIFAVFHALQGSAVLDLVDEMGEQLRYLFAKKGVEVDPRQAGIDVIVPLVRKFAGAALNFPNEKFLARCMQEATVWLELNAANNSEKAETTRALALRYDTTPGKIQKIFQRMSEEYGKVK